MNDILKSKIITLSGALIVILLSWGCARVELNSGTYSAQTSVARIYLGLTSQTNKEAFEAELVKAIVSNHFEGATIQNSVGLYKGESENSLIVTIINCCSWTIPEEKFRQRLNNLFFDLKHKLDQESILVEYSNQSGAEIFELNDTKKLKD